MDEVMHRVTLLFLFSAEWLFAQFEGTSCAVNLRVLNTYGQPEPYFVASFKNAEGAELSGNFQDLRGRVPCALHAYRFLLKRRSVSAQLARATSEAGDLFVSYPEVWRTVSIPQYRISADGQHGGGASGDGMTSRDYMWRGRILGKFEGKLWITFRSLAVLPFDNVGVVVEAEVDQSGNFRVYQGMIQGPYMITITDQSSKILHMATAWCEKSLLSDQSRLLFRMFLRSQL